MTPEEFLCFSIAWDWMYQGVTVEGINRETAAILGMFDPQSASQPRKPCYS
jgi:hypothetical protein